jgi:Ca2+-transporting ATPase
LGVDVQNGLPDEEVKQRQEKYGPNELIETGVKSPLTIFLAQFKEIMVIVLIVAAVVSTLLGEFLDASVIMIIVILNAILGFSQEYRAEQAMAALKRMSVPSVRVRRGGRVMPSSPRLRSSLGT